MNKRKFLVLFSIAVVIIFAANFFLLKNKKKTTNCKKLEKVVKIYLNHLKDKEEFFKKIKFLKDEGFSPVLISEIYNHKIYGEKLPKNPVVIIINDGDKSWNEIIFPSLKKLNLKGNFFLTTDFGVGLLTWRKIREIKNFKNLKGENLFEIGSHSVSHSSAIFHESEAHIDNEENEFNFRSNILYELFYSKKIIEENTKSKISFFSIPYSGFSDYSKEAIILRKIAKDVGYRGILSASSFVIPDKFFIKAQMINLDIPFEKFKTELNKAKKEICR